MNRNTADTDGDDFDEDDYNFLSPLLLTQNFVSSPTEIDSSIDAAANLFLSLSNTNNLFSNLQYSGKE